MKVKILLFVFLPSFFLLKNIKAQIPNCDTLVPVHYVDLTGPNASVPWTSPSTIRNGNCCGTMAPDLCELFVITTDSNTVGVTFAICGGPLPNGGMYYELDCASYVICSDTVLISSPGVHYLTFCKPGSVANNFCITPIGPQMPAGQHKNEITYSSFTKDLSGDYWLNLSLLSPLSFTLSIFSVDGKKISEKGYSLDSGHHQIPVSSHELETGIYFCRVVGDRVDKSFKFIK